MLSPVARMVTKMMATEWCTGCWNSESRQQQQALTTSPDVTLTVRRRSTPTKDGH